MSLAIAFMALTMIDGLAHVPRPAAITPEKVRGKRDGASLGTVDEWGRSGTADDLLESVRDEPRELTMSRVNETAARPTAETAKQVAQGPAERGRWKLAPPPEAALPRLNCPVRLDGDLSEWEDAAVVPIGCASYLTRLMPGRVWRGPSDLSALVYCAWNDDGLCLAAAVTDDDVRNSAPLGEAWRQDCVEFFVDARTDHRFLTSPPSPGFRQILVRPPVDGRPAQPEFVSGATPMEGLRIGSRRTPDGYTFELLVPWSNFPGFDPRPGACLGLQFNVEDFDAVDGETVQPLQMAWQGATLLYLSPHKLIPWTLVERLPRDPKAPVSALTTLDVPERVSRRRVRVGVEAGPCVAQAQAAQVTVLDWAGRLMHQRRLKLNDRGVSGRPAASLTWRTGSALDGAYRVEAAFLDRAGEGLGVARRSILLTARSLEEANKMVSRALSELRHADLPRRAQRDPFRAAAWCGVMAAVEKLKRSVELEDPYLAVDATTEVAARLAVVKHGEVPDAAGGLHRLLTLAAIPEAQVVVDYPYPARQSGFQTRATVAFYWGSFPLAACMLTPGDETDRPAGCRIVELSAQGPEAARLVREWVEALRPVTPADADALRRATLRALVAAGSLDPPPADGLGFFTGDVHEHTFFSDGASSPIGLTLAALYSFLDFNVITDHETVEGALFAQRLLERFRVRHNLVVGVETGDFAHLNVYPLKGPLVLKTGDSHESARLAHAAGALIQWNHPGSYDAEFFKQHGSRGIEGTGLDAWEGLPGNYTQRKAEGRLPPLVGGTDSHEGVCNPTANWIPRTVILAPSCDRGDEVAAAIRAGRTMLLYPTAPGLFFGSDEMVRRAQGALAEGWALKEATAQRLRRVFERADPVGLLRASPPKPPRRSWPP